MNMKLGQQYSTSTSNENMSKFFTTSRMGQVVTGYSVYSQTWLNKKGYKTSDSYDQKNTAEGFENQYSMFLTYKNNGKTYHGVPRNVYSPIPNKAGEITDLAKWPRVTSLSTTMTWKSAWASGLVKNPTAQSIFISKGILNKDYEKSYNNLLIEIGKGKTESLNPQVDARIADLTNFVTPNKAAEEFLPEDFKNNEMLNISDEVAANTSFYIDVASVTEEYEHMYSEFKMQ